MKSSLQMLAIVSEENDYKWIPDCRFPYTIEKLFITQIPFKSVHTLAIRKN